MLLLSYGILFQNNFLQRPKRYAEEELLPNLCQNCALLIITVTFQKQINEWGNTACWRKLSIFCCCQIYISLYRDLHIWQIPKNFTKPILKRWRPFEELFDRDLVSFCYDRSSFSLELAKFCKIFYPLFPAILNKFWKFKNFSKGIN